MPTIAGTEQILKSETSDLGLSEAKGARQRQSQEPPYLLRGAGADISESAYLPTPALIDGSIGNAPGLSGARKARNAHDRTMRTGPLGRLARLVLAAVGVASFVSIADQGGPAPFIGARNLTEPSLLLLDALMLMLFVSLVTIIARSLGSRRSAERWGIAALVAISAAVVIAARDEPVRAWDDLGEPSQ